MLRNYLKVALRNFVNQKYYSTINTLGLALGIAACIMILLFVQDELSYEQSFENHDQVYRLVQDFPMGEHLSMSATVPFPTKNAMLEDFPDITNAALMFRPSAWGNTPVIRYGDEEYFEDDLIFAEHSFLEIYDFTLKEFDSIFNTSKLCCIHHISGVADDEYFAQASVKNNLRSNTRI